MARPRRKTGGPGLTLEPRQTGEEQIATNIRGVVITDPAGRPSIVPFAEIATVGIGNVVGPASSVDNAFALFDGISGKLLKSSKILSVETAVTANRTLTFPDTNLDLTPNTGTYAAAAHHTRHESGGADAIKLDDLAAPDDNTDLNASTTAHGLLRKLSNVATDFLDGTGNWSTPSGGGGGLPVVDTTAIAKGSGDATKQVRFEVDGLTTATTRVLTMADQDISLVPNTGSFAGATHASRHQSGGADEIALDTLGAPTDITTLNSSTSAHGLLKKLSNSALEFMDGTGAWRKPVTIIVKPSDESVTSSTTLQNDDDFSFSIAANEKVIIHAHLFVSGNSAGDFQWAFNVPSLATGWNSGLRVIDTTASTNNSGAWSAIEDLTDTGFRASGTVTGSTVHVQIDAIVINGANAGTIQFRWAQVTSNATATVVEAGSYMSFTRAA